MEVGRENYSSEKWIQINIVRKIEGGRGICSAVQFKNPLELIEMMDDFGIGWVFVHKLVNNDHFQGYLQIIGFGVD